MSDADDPWRWGLLVGDCVNSFRTEQHMPVRFVDYEVIPQFDGSPDKIWIWFICTQKVETAPFREQCLDDATNEIRQRLLRQGFPKSAASSLGSDVTSLEEIEDGGGRFAFFR